MKDSTLFRQAVIRQRIRRMSYEIRGQKRYTKYKNVLFVLMPDNTYYFFSFAADILGQGFFADVRIKPPEEPMMKDEPKPRVYPPPKPKQPKVAETRKRNERTTGVHRSACVG
jgi:hypothetical protein